jgi:hypothetical protein
MIVMEIQFTPVPIIAVLDPNDRLAEVSQVEEKTFLDLFELATLDLVKIILVVVFVAKHLVATAEVGSQERVDERDIVMDSPDLEDLLTAQAKLPVPFLSRVVVVALLVFRAKLPLVPAVFDIAQKLDTEFVWVETSGLSSHGAGVMVGIVHKLGWVEDFLGHDGRVPE